MTDGRCQLCRSEMDIVEGYQRYFYKCHSCELVYAKDYDLDLIKNGMGFEDDQWEGFGGGGYREYYLIHFLQNKLSKKRFLLFGTGNTQTFNMAISEGVDIIGSDISTNIVNCRKNEFGNDSFFLPQEIPENIIFDAIIAVEVIEHFHDIRKDFDLLFSHLHEEGVICGTTNFYPGGDIEDGNSPGYMSWPDHITYWSEKGLRLLLAEYNFSLYCFELLCPGSVIPDKKFKQLWPNKRVFFISKSKYQDLFFKKLKIIQPILPIDKP